MLKGMLKAKVYYSDFLVLPIIRCLAEEK
jgi:hypothetical protein